MPRNNTHLIVFVTTPVADGDSVASELLRLRLAACVSIIPNIQSHYRWKDKTEDARESLLLIKTTLARFNELENAVRRLHPYQVPEILAIRIDRGSGQYLRWIRKEIEVKPSLKKRVVSSNRSFVGKAKP